MSVAPLYVLVCGALYGYHDMAQTIGVSNFAVLEQTHWIQFAKDCAVPPVLLERLAAGLHKRMKQVLPRIAEDVAKKTSAKTKNLPHDTPLMFQKKPQTIIDAIKDTPCASSP